MKRIYLFLACAVLTAGHVSCKRDGFLDRFPKDAFNEKTYFKTEEDLKLFANRFYDNLPTVTSFAADDNSDNMLPRSINGYLAGTYTIPESGGGWAIGDWSTIRQCNYFLQRYSGAQSANKELYAGEVKFFRALFYWQKVARFGDVPLVLADLDDASEELFGPRVDRKLVMDQVLLDLNFAVDNLPEKGAQQVGRLNKDVALALKSRIALWEGTYRKYRNLGDHDAILKEAVAASELLMNSNNYQVYKTGNIGEDYHNLFTQRDLSSNSEAILFRAYISGLTTQGYTRTATENNTGFTKDFADQYLFVDGKPIGATTFSYDDSDPEKEHLNRDPRYAQTIATPDFIWRIDEGGETLKTGLPGIGTSRTSSGYWNIKGRSSEMAQWVADQSDVDAFIFRYGEVLLNFIEAKYELSGSVSQADLNKSINLLRERVGMPALLTNVAADPNAINYGYAVSPLLYEIRRERRVELAAEGFRFQDLMRWKAGKLIERTNTIRGMKLTDAVRSRYSYNIDNVVVDQNKLINVYPSLSGNRKWDDKMYLYPLPIDQITLAKYSQNKGWDK